MNDVQLREKLRIATTTAALSAVTCRWATPTVFLAAPYWIEAESAPWACLRDTIPRVLGTTDQCAVCPRWEPRSDQIAVL